MTYIKNVSEKEWQILENLPRLEHNKGERTGMKKIIYKKTICSFDIETSRLPDSEHSFMYIWQINFLGIITIYGRYWNEFIYLLERITKRYQYNEWLLIFVHNLSFEMQFLRGIMPFNKEDVFCTERRKILYAKSGHVEFRCSYFLTNMGLGTFLDKMKVEHPKEEKIDYNALRYPWDVLSEDVMRYSEMDVVGLSEGIKKQNEINHDTFYTMPYTSTGYIRRMTKEALQTVSYPWRKAIQPTLKVYTMLREAFRGGNTHANRWYAGEFLENVKSIDRSSSYPSELVNKKYPLGEFKKANTAKLDEYISKDKACLFKIKFKKIKLKSDLWGCPYLSSDKSRGVKNAVFDNGRILEADELETTITDIDYKIINEEYEYEDYEVLKLYITCYKPLPKVFKNLINQLFGDKTKLKGIPGQEIFYMKQKNLLNSLYGMCAQDIAKDRFLLDGKEYIKEITDKEVLIDKAKNRAFLPYQIGVWCTCYAREELEKGIKMAGEGFVYTDTDSVKYFGDIDKRLNEYNKKQEEISKKNEAYAEDSKGKYHYMGVYEEEKESDIFITYGAKKYACVQDGKLKITIAGVNKEEGAKEIGDIYKLKPGYIFEKAGGTESVYNDAAYGEILETRYIDGHILKITSNVTIRESTYKLGLTSEYFDLLNEMKTSGLYYKVMEKMEEKYK